MIETGPTLVTGAYGLIGHAVVSELTARGNPVVATDQLDTPPDDALVSARPLTIAGVDILTDFIVAHRIENVVHAAGISGPMLARDQPHLIFAVNVGGTLDLFEAARRASVRRIVFLSSASVYGRTADTIVAETAPLRAIDAYGSSKIAAEAIARAYAACHGVEAVILRPSWVYGPRRRTACVIRTMACNALAGKPSLFAFGRGFPRQFVHVDDVASAVLAALSAPHAAGGTFNITDGTRRTLDQVADIIQSILPEARIEMEYGDDPDDDYVGPLDLSSAARCLGWQPKISFEAGVRTYVAYLSTARRPAGLPL